MVKICYVDRDRTTLGRRINSLAQEGYVLQDRTKERGRVFVSITQEGEKLLGEASE